MFFWYKSTFAATITDMSTLKIRGRVDAMSTSLAILYIMHAKIQQLQLVTWVTTLAN